MGQQRARFDRILFLVIVALVVGGLFIFASASLGLLARGTVPIQSVLFSHILLGIGGGMIALYIASKIRYRVWKQFAIPLYILSLIATALVFIPALGLSSGGAVRWILIGPVSFQPSEALKVGVILALAMLFSTYRHQVQSSWKGLGVLLLVLLGPAVLLLAQPDTGTFGVILITAGAMFVATGARFKEILILGILAVAMVLILAFFRPYVLERFSTFLNPLADPTGGGYQIKQSLIAVGSGGIVGRGFGQSVQKFSYLPEPMSDSIFAVAAEEFGLIGSLFIIGLFIAFAVRGFWTAAHSPDYFGALLAVGIVSYIVGQAFINIASMLGVIPLTGLPLVFISHGGSAMLVALASCGILLNISRYAK